MISFRCLSLAFFTALAVAHTSSAATILDDSFTDSSSVNQNLATNSVQIFKSRTGTTRTDANGSVTYGQTQASAEAHWFHFTETTPVSLQVGDSITASATFSLTTPAASGGTVRFGLFDSKTTRLLADKTGGQSDAMLTDDLGYMGQLATDTNVSAGPFTWLGRRDTLTTQNFFNSTADFPVLASLTAGSTDRVALASGVSYTLSIKVERQSSTVNIVTLAITGGSLPSTYTYTGTDNGAATSSYAFDWFGFRYSGSNLASAVVFTNVKVVTATASVPAPAITTSPASQTVNVGANASFSVVATGSGLSYQWYKDTVAIGSATSDTLALNNVQLSDAGSYTVRVTNSGGNATSSAATLTVNTPAVAPAITTHPVGQTVNAGAIANFSVIATGTAPLTYQWKKGGSDIGGATSATYTIASTVTGDSGSYTVVVTNAAGSATSNAAVLTVNSSAGPAPAITTQPSNNNIVAGSGVTLSVAASGTGLTYQWKKNGVDISGATGAILVIASPVASDAGNYTVVVTNAGGSTTSSVARLSVAAAGGLAWQSYDAVTGSRVSADAAVFDPATNTYTFTIPASSVHTLVTTSFVPLVLTKPATGSSNLPVTFSMKTSGGYGISGSVANAYTGFGLFNHGGTLPAATGNFTDDKGLWNEFVQTAGTLSMKPQSVTSAVAFCPVGLMARDINAPYGMGTGTGGNLGTISDNLWVDMTVRPSALPAGTVQLGTSASAASTSGGVVIDRDTAGTVLSRRVYSSGSTGLSVTSASITFNEFGYQFQNTTTSAVTVQLANFTGLTTPPYFTTQPPSSMIGTHGESVTFTTVAAGSPVSYQWQVSTDGGANFTNINSASNASAATASLTLTNVRAVDAGIYQLVAANAAGSTTSAQVTLTTSAAPFAPVIALQPVSKTVTAGASASFSVTASGTSPMTYQWRKSTDGGTTYVDVSGATSATLTFASATIADNGLYVVRLTNSQGTLTSAAATFTVNQAPIISAQPASATPAVGASLTLSVVATASPAPTYQWKKNGVNISGAMTSSLALTNVSGADTGNYTVTITNAAGSVTSSTASVNVLSAALAATSFTPGNVATAVFPDAPLKLTFNQPITAGLNGSIKIYDASSPSAPVETISFSSATARTASAAILALPVQSKTIGTLAGFNYYPVTISGSTATIYPRNLSLTYGKTYYVTVDAGTFTDANGLAFSGISSTSAWTFTTRAAPATGVTNYTVATDGSGDFASVQAALDFIPVNNTTPTTILIKNGTYNEIVYWVSKNQLTIKGESRAGTIVGYANNNTLNPQGTNGRAAFEGRTSTGTVLTNLTIKNFTPIGGSQAEAVYFNNNADAQTIITGVNLISFQDTLNVNGPTYISNTYIEGDTDFMWGNGPIFFENCELKMLTSGAFYTQVRNPATNHGFVYLNCLFSAGDGVTSAYLGRINQNAPAYSEMVLLNCRVADNVLLPAAWDPNGITDRSTTLCVEFNSRKQSDGAVLDVAGRASWSYQWTQPANATEITNYSNAFWVLNTQKNGTANTTTWTPALAPVIATQPASVTGAIGQLASFTVAATGAPAPTYQWKKDGNNITGATSATFTVTSPVIGDAGSYTVAVTNASGTATSSAATLSLATLPVITTQPASISGVIGQSASFTVVATGSPVPAYQWKKDGNNITGATSASYAIASPVVGDAGSYTVVVTNTAGSVTSNAATLTLGSLPAITTQPANVSVNVGGSAIFSVVATGTGPLTYQWQKNSVNINGATSSSYMINPVQTIDGASYRVVVTNALGSATSNAATLTVGTVFTAPVPDGYAASVTGGGTSGVAVNATTAADFRTYAEDTTARTITVSGTLNLGATKVSVKSNKTIQGIDGNATLVGNLELASGVSNVVIRGLNITNTNAGADGISIIGASNVYITHCTLFDCADGLIDITAGADNITVSWCEFYYTTAQTAHRYAMTVGAATGETKALRVSLHHNWFSDRADQSMPVTTWGQVHMYNNFLNSTGNTSATSVLASAQLLSERNQYTSLASPLTKSGGGLIRANNNVYTTTTGTAADAGTDTVFTPSYSYEMLVTADVSALVQTGAGNTAGAASASLASAAATITASGTSITTGSSFTLTASFTGFTGTAYQWRLNNAPITGGNAATYTVASAQAAHAGVYTVLIVKASGDVVSAPVTISVNTPPVTPAAVGKKEGGGAPSIWFFATLSLLALGRRFTRRCQDAISAG